MVRSAIADESLLTYLSNLGESGSCTVGLILGQPTPIKDYVIHFARTPPSQGQEALAKREANSPNITKNLSDISDAWVAEHAKYTTRMLPGGMYVLGIFIVSEDDVFAPFPSKLKNMLLQMNKQLDVNPFLYGNPENTEKLVLNYCTDTKLFSCKSYDVTTCVVKPADFKFMPKALKWHQLECKCELDQVYPIPESDINLPLKKHMIAIMHTTNESLKSAVFLFDGEVKDGEENLEQIGKKRKVPRSKSGHTESVEPKAIQVQIFLPCDGHDLQNSLEIMNCGGHMRMTGQVVCKLWLHPKATVSFASQAVTQDLVRSLAARLEMHWDSLIQEECAPSEDTSTIHEPPRRVLVSLPSSKITLSDYLFPGEGPQEAQTSLLDMLDISVNEDEDIKDIEGQADLSEYYEGGLDSESDEVLSKLPADSHKFMYFLGIGVAFFVLILSLVIHYFKEYLY